MKKSLVMLAALGAALGWAQQAVLYVGSDWDEASARVRPAWEAPAFAKAAGVALAVVDQPDRVDAAVQAKWKEQAAIRLEPRVLPAVAYFDKSDTCVYLHENVRDPKDLGAAVKAGQARADVVAKALAGDDVDAVGRALAPMVRALGLKPSKEKCKALWDKLAALDPKDASGWAWALAFNPADGETYKVQDFRKKKDFAGGEAFIKSLEAKPQTHLTTEQRQGLALLRYVLYKDDASKTAEVNTLLNAVLAMDPTTHFGIAAQGLLCLRGQGPVAIPYGWRPKDAKAGRQTWTIDVGVAKTIRGPGRYELTLKREKGRGPMRVSGLAIGGTRVACDVTIDVGKSAAVAFQVPPGARPNLALDVTFANPQDERGTLALRRILPARETVAPQRIRPARGPWAKALTTAVPAETLAEIAKRQGGADFLNALLADDAWLQELLCSGDPLTGWSATLRALDRMCFHEPAILRDPTLKRWAAAAALNAAADPTEIVLLLQEALALRAEGFHIRGTDALRCDQLRYLMIPAQCDAANARWLATQHNVPPRLYHGVCWAAPYRLNNFLGDSIHGADYYKPWEHAYLRHEASRKVGAVCGGLSYYGSAAAKTHGLMSTTGGQPAHCAYLLWAPTLNRWQIAYNVNPYTGSHFSPWADVWKYSYHELIADATARPGMRASMTALWQARVRRAALAPAPTRTPMTCDAYVWNGNKLPDDPSKLQRLGTWRGLTELSVDQADGRRDHVLLVWTGSLEVARDQEVEITLRSDDGGGLWLDGRHIAGKDGLHGLEGSTCRLTLTKGKHPFELRYFNFNGGRGLEFTVTPVERADAEVERLYRQAAQACPQNLLVWRDWAAWLRACKADAAAWRALGDRAAEGLKDHVEPAWDFLLGITPHLRDKASALIAWNGVIRQGPQPTSEFCNYGAVLDAMAKQAGDDTETLFACFAAALKAQYDTPAAFGALMRWGGDRFLKDAALADRYIAAVEGLLSRDGAGDALGKYLREAIRAASQAGNIQAFQSLSALQLRLTNPDRRALTDIGMPGTLLSAKGLLRLSTTSNWDSPDGYLAVIDGSTALAPFHTSQEKAPWAEILLPGMAEVSGVFLRNRGDQNDGRLVPFTVEVSEDGKAWTKVGESDKTQTDYRFTFPPVRANRVRVICHPKDRTFLHLRKFCVFGKPLY